MASQPGLDHPRPRNVASPEVTHNCPASEEPTAADARQSAWHTFPGMPVAQRLCSDSMPQRGAAVAASVLALEFPSSWLRPDGWEVGSCSFSKYLLKTCCTLPAPPWALGYLQKQGTHPRGC